MSTILMWLITIILVLNVIQLPLMAALEGLSAFITRSRYDGVGESIFTAKHSVWSTYTDIEGFGEFFDAWFLWDFLAGIVLWIILAVLIAINVIWWILGGIAVLFGLRFLVDSIKDSEDE